MRADGNSGLGVPTPNFVIIILPGSCQRCFYLCKGSDCDGSGRRKCPWTKCGGVGHQDASDFRHPSQRALRLEVWPSFTLEAKYPCPGPSQPAPCFTWLLFCVSLVTCHQQGPWPLLSATNLGPTPPPILGACMVPSCPVGPVMEVCQHSPWAFSLHGLCEALTVMPPLSQGSSGGRNDNLPSVSSQPAFNNVLG